MRGRRFCQPHVCQAHASGNGAKRLPDSVDPCKRAANEARSFSLSAIATTLPPRPRRGECCRNRRRLDRTECPKRISQATSERSPTPGAIAEQRHTSPVRTRGLHKAKDAPQKIKSFGRSRRRYLDFLLLIGAFGVGAVCISISRGSPESMPPSRPAVSLQCADNPRCAGCFSLAYGLPVPKSRPINCGRSFGDAIHVESTPDLFFIHIVDLGRAAPESFWSSTVLALSSICKSRSASNMVPKRANVPSLAAVSVRRPGRNR